MKRDLTPAIIAGAVVAGFFLVVILLMTGFVRPPADNPAAWVTIGVVIGVVLSGFNTALQYVLGSSLGSRSKDDILAGAMRGAPAPPPPLPAPAAPTAFAPPNDTARNSTPPSASAPPFHVKTLTGKVSTFGGPNDKGVAANEGLALCELNEIGKFAGLFLPAQPSDTSGLARRLDPAARYIACRWDYHETPRVYLQGIEVEVAANGKAVKARPIDWGPNANTGRVADLSPAVAAALGLSTDDIASVTIPLPWASAQAAAPGAGLSAKVAQSATHLRAMAQSQADLERIFGKFTYTEGEGGRIDIDPAWVKANIVSVDIPQLHKFTKGNPIECHRLIAEPLKAAFVDIEAAGLLDDIVTYDGLWVARHKNWDPQRGISLHSWGAAFDINAEQNPYGGMPAAPGSRGSNDRFAPIFEKHGFAWGAWFGRQSLDAPAAPDTDGMHFEYCRTS
jgi:D-alanyl-D-alanine carboxypeptidase-like protein